METKEIGVQHGAAVRSKVGKAALLLKVQATSTGRTLCSLRNPAQRFVADAVGRATHRAKLAGAYAAGFAQGLVRRGNVSGNV